MNSSDIMREYVKKFSNLSHFEDLPLISTIFDLSMENKRRFVDPYDSYWLKLITIGIYGIQLLSATVKIAFVIYETRGLAGHYRTLINQLLSYLYGAVSIYKQN